MTEIGIVFKVLVQYGAVGVIALLGLYFGRSKDKELKEQSLAHAKVLEAKNEQIQKLQSDHKKEMEVLHERHNVKAETWMQQYYESDDKKTEALQVMEKLVSRLLNQLRPPTNGG